MGYALKCVITIPHLKKGDIIWIGKFGETKKGVWGESVHGDCITG